jgi:hypothetical protein
MLFCHTSEPLSVSENQTTLPTDSFSPCVICSSTSKLGALMPHSIRVTKSKLIPSLPELRSIEQAFKLPNERDQ